MQLSNHLHGLIFGQAIGDALGLASEFMTKEEVLQHYPDGINSYDDIINDRHRSIWQKGAWTDDTDQMLCILDSIVKHRAINLIDIAERFVNWKKTNGRGIGRHTLNVLSIGDYTQDPFKVSELVWTMSRKQSAANGAIMRTSILGAWDYSNWENVEKNTEIVCKLTHYDPRCVGSCVVITYLIHCYLIDKAISKNELIDIGNKYDKRIAEYIELAFQNDIEQLKLDELGKLGYTLKTMSAALWAFNHAADFQSGLKRIIEQGGDADTNGAVAGALLGLKLGLDRIPKDLVDSLVGREELIKKSELFIESLTL